MAEFNAIAATLKKQREDLEKQTSDDSTRSAGTDALVSQIGDLRRRSEETLRRFQAVADRTARKK